MTEVQASPRGHVARLNFVLTTVGGWFLLLGVQLVLTARDPRLLNVVLILALTCLFSLYVLDVGMLRNRLKSGQSHLQRHIANSAYRSELEGLPNRNYLLSELRKEMPRARGRDVPFTLIHLSVEHLEAVREERGEAARDRLVSELITILNRVTRESDFFAHLGGGEFCVMLNECTADLARHYLNRTPDVVSARTDGGGEIERPIVARVYEYDLETLYALDVLREVETTGARRMWRRLAIAGWLMNRLAGQKPGHETAVVTLPERARVDPQSRPA